MLATPLSLYHMFERVGTSITTREVAILLLLSPQAPHTFPPFCLYSSKMDTTRAKIHVKRHVEDTAPDVDSRSSRWAPVFGEGSRLAHPGTFDNSVREGVAVAAR